MNTKAAEKVRHFMYQMVSDLKVVGSHELIGTTSTAFARHGMSRAEICGQILILQDDGRLSFHEGFWVLGRKP